MAERLGTYALTVIGRKQEHVVLRQQHGHVYVNDERFSPAAVPGLFFSGAGHVLDLRPPRPSWRVIPLTPIDRELAAPERGSLLATSRRFADRMGEGNLEAALAEVQPALRNDTLGRAVEDAWKQLVVWFGPYSSSPRAEIWPLAEGGRVDLWARFGKRDVMLRFVLNVEGQIRAVWLGKRDTWWASVPADAP